ncbi:hypothetical protein FRB90_011225, partial [Tulasnella sp. 427]
MSNSNVYPLSSSLTLAFPAEPFSGPVVDSYGTVFYQLYLNEGVLGGKKESVVSRIGPQGTNYQVAVITWGGLTRNKNVVVGGQDRGKLLDHWRNGFFSSPQYWFIAGDGREYYWKKLE